MKWLRTALLGLMIIPSLSLVSSLALPSHSASAACTNTFLTFPAWYKDLQASDCSFEPKKDSAGKTDFQATTVVIVLNVVNIIMQLVGYAAVAFLIVGGFNYMTAQGESDKMSGAKKTILNAIIGLVISIMSVAIVNLIVGAL